MCFVTISSCIVVGVCVRACVRACVSVSVSVNACAVILRTHAVLTFLSTKLSNEMLIHVHALPFRPTEMLSAKTHVIIIMLLKSGAHLGFYLSNQPIFLHVHDCVGLNLQSHDVR